MSLPNQRFHARLLLLLTAVGSALVAGCTDSGADRLRVYAASSLSEVMEAQVRAYSPSGHDVELAFGGSNVLARQILAADDADVFISAGLAQLDLVEEADLIVPGSRRNLLTNQLVVVVHADATLELAAPADLAGTEINRIALADPEAVPAGRYARIWLERAGVWPEIKDRVIPTRDVRAALAAAASGAVQAAVVYRTDAAISDRTRIAFAADPKHAPVIAYPMAAVVGGSMTAEALRFLDWLESDEAEMVFRRHGFHRTPVAKADRDG